MMMINDDENDDDADDANSWLETSSWWRAGLERHNPYVESDSFCRDSELG